MVITCPKCATKFKIADEKIKGEGTKVRCSKCREVFPIGGSADTLTESAQPEPAPKQSIIQDVNLDFDIGSEESPPTPAPPAAEPLSSDILQLDLPSLPASAFESISPARSEPEEVKDDESATGYISVSVKHQTDIESKTREELFDFSNQSSPNSSPMESPSFIDQPPAMPPRSAPAAQSDEKLEDLMEKPSLDGPVHQSRDGFTAPAMHITGNMDFESTLAQGIQPTGDSSSSSAEMNLTVPEGIDLVRTPQEMHAAMGGTLKRKARSDGALPSRSAKSASPFMDLAPSPRTSKLSKIALDQKPERNFSWLSNALIGGIIMAVLAYAMVIRVHGSFSLGHLNIKTAKAFLVSFGQHKREQIQDASVASFSLQNPVTSLVQNVQSQSVLVIGGEAINHNTTARSKVMVKVDIFAVNGEKVLERETWAGNIFSREEIFPLTSQEAIDALYTPAGRSPQRAGINMNIPPNGKVPYQILFYRPAPEWHEFTVKVIRAEVSAGS